jgi:DNA polymerase
MDILDLDIETYSSVELKKANVYAYTESPDFEILMCGWSLNGSPIEVWNGEEAIKRIPGLFDPDVKKVAHNAPFERICFSRLAGLPVGQYLDPEQYFDTMAVAALHGLPRGLDALAKALRVTPKDSAGTDLIGLFCKPYRGRRVMPHERPEKYEAFMRYCAQDVGTMQEVRAVMPGWPKDGFERELWYLDQRVNDRGIKVDLDLAHGAIDIAKRNTAESEREVIEITGVANPGSTKQLGEWCASRGFEMPNWQGETVKDALMRSDVPEDVEQVLRLRQELALVAHRKFEAAARGCSLDGRLRGQFMYHAAHTGRWSSRGVQVHNLARLAFEYKDPETGEKEYDDIAEDLAIECVKHGISVSPETLKKAVRPMFILDGVTSDFSAIEARVLQAFLDGRDLYVEQADRMGDGMERPDGKIAILAGGYQGSVGSFRNMGYGGRQCPFDITRQLKVKDPRTGREYHKPFENIAQHAKTAADSSDYINTAALQQYLLRAKKLRIPLEEVTAAIEGHARERQNDPNHKCDAEIKEVVNAYREANPKIVAFWYDMEKKFWTGGVVGAGMVRVEVRGKNRSVRWVHLPSGRILKYYGVHKQTVKKTDPDTGEVIGSKQQLAYRHVQGYTEKTYGGRLTENVTQAIARDLLAHAMLELTRAGYEIVGHVHDEALVASRDAEGIRSIMRAGPAWAEGLPLDASAGVLYRYRKD